MTIDLTKLMALDPTITLAQFAALIAATELHKDQFGIVVGITVTARGYGATLEPIAAPITAPKPEPVEVVPAVTAKPVETKPASSDGAFDCKKCGLPTKPSESGGRSRPDWCGPCAAESHRQAALKSQAAQAVKLWPTAKARDWKGVGPANYERHDPDLNAAVKMWPTATSSDGTGGPGNSGRDGGENLRTAVKLWATATVSGNNNRVGCSEKSGDGLRTQVCGSLNPAWVECLMDYPPGWSDPSRPLGDGTPGDGSLPEQ